MKIRLLTLLIIFTLSMMPTFAHGNDEDDGEDEPANAISETITQSDESDSTLHSDSETPNVTTLNVDQSTATLFFVGGAFALVFGVVLWAVFGQDMPMLLVIANILTGYTALIHLESGLSGDLLLLANGAGFIAIALLRSVQSIRQASISNGMALVLLIYTGITFFGYFLLHDHIEVVGLSSKIAEALLVITILMQIFNRRQANPTQHAGVSPAI